MKKNLLIVATLAAGLSSVAQAKAFNTNKGEFNGKVQNYIKVYKDALECGKRAKNQGSLDACSKILQNALVNIQKRGDHRANRNSMTRGMSGALSGIGAVDSKKDAEKKNKTGKY